jgi:quercetin dioxygenase-like cupin family protein
MELSERCIATLEKEGFAHIYEWQDAPDTVYAEHRHKGKVSLFVTDGSISIAIDGDTTVYHTGDRVNISPLTEHSAVVGSLGVQLVVGEEIEGDS